MQRFDKYAYLRLDAKVATSLTYGAYTACGTGSFANTANTLQLNRVSFTGNNTEQACFAFSLHPLWDRSLVSVRFHWAQLAGVLQNFLFQHRATATRQADNWFTAATAVTLDPQAASAVTVSQVSPWRTLSIANNPVPGDEIVYAIERLPDFAISTHVFSILIRQPLTK